MVVVVMTLAVLSIVYNTTNTTLAQQSTAGGIQTVNQADCLSLSKQINKDNTDKSISPAQMLDLLNNYIHHCQ